MRPLLATALLLAAACSYAPPGTCSDDAQCGTGRVCTNGICIGCDRDTDCRAWQACAVSTRTCTLASGRCLGPSDCQPWQTCDGTRTCVAAPGSCADASGCAGWEGCSADHACTPLPGRCASAAGCESWQTCDATHVCAAAPGYCSDASGCAAWEDCTGHRCLPKPGRCNAAADCPGWFPACSATSWCVEQPGDADVMMWGNLGTTCTDAIAPASAPSAGRVGFSCSSRSWTAMVEPGGTVLYASGDRTPRRLVRFEPDAWTSTAGTWSYPSTGWQNDPEVATSACLPTEQVSRFVVREQAGELLYACDVVTTTAYVPPSTSWYDASGLVTNVVALKVYAWNAEGAIAGRDAGNSSTVWTAADRTPRAITGLPGDVIDVRAHGSGFWFAVCADPGINLGCTNAELWDVDGAGSATLHASYAPTPSGVSRGPDSSTIGGNAMDRTGSLYSADSTWASEPVIVRYPSDGSPATIVYRREAHPADANTSPSNLWVHEAFLFRGP